MEILPKRKSDFIEPMDCSPVFKLPDGLNWVFEIKLDGYRAVAVKSDRGVNLYSRRHKSFNRQYPHLVEALDDLPDGAVVDGEVVALVRFQNTASDADNTFQLLFAHSSQHVVRCGVELFGDEQRFERGPFEFRA